MDTLLLPVETTSDLVAQLEHEAKRQTRCTIMSTVAGTIIGWVIGVAQLIYIGSWPLFYWVHAVDSNLLGFGRRTVRNDIWRRPVCGVESFRR